MSAVDYARAVQRGSNVRWGRVEDEAFAAHAEALDPSKTRGGSNRPGKKKKMTPAGLALYIPAVVFGIVILGSPIWGFALSSGTGSRFSNYPSQFDPNTVMAAAGTGFAIAGLVIIGITIDWVVKKFPITGFTFGYPAVTFPLAVIAAVSMAADGRDDDVELWPLWVSVAAAVAALSGLLTAVIFILRLRRQSGSTVPLAKADELARRLRAADALPEADRAAIAADLEAAISDLESRGVITADAAVKARGAGLGGLAIVMQGRPVKAENPAEPARRA